MVGVDKVLQSRPVFGDFYRPLPPGRHALVFRAAGFAEEVIEVEVPEDGTGVELDVWLDPLEPLEPAAAAAFMNGASSGSGGSGSGGGSGGIGAGGM